jgi:arylsulfatase A-like enzyme
MGCGEIQFVDAAIGQMVTALKHEGLLDSTLIIITAKHGQSPADTHRFFEPPTTPADILVNADPGFLPVSESPLTKGGSGPTQDDISLLWLAPGKSLLGAVALLEANKDQAAISEIFYGPSLATMFNPGGLPPLDPRTPDIIVQPNIGAIYSTSGKKQAEHGGFAFDDTNVMLLVSNPSFKAKTVTSFVETMQVAPTILQALGLDPG